MLGETNEAHADCSTGNFWQRYVDKMWEYCQMLGKQSLNLLPFFDDPACRKKYATRPARQRPTAHAPGGRQCYRRRQSTPTNDDDRR